MFRRLWVAGLLAPALLVLAVPAARADRVPSSKVVVQPNTGARVDITVPYTTNGYSALGVYGRVAPKIYASPIVEDKANPGAKPVYNLIFYGSVQSFGSKSNGATPRPPGPPLNK